MMALSMGQRQLFRRVLQDAAASNRTNGCIQNSGVGDSTRCHSTQGSPVPYLLAGLAAMFALVAFSLIILACSYWKMVGRDEAENARASITQGIGSNVSCLQAIGDQNFGLGEARITQGTAKVMVIVAGEDKPTFFAKPSAWMR